MYTFRGTAIHRYTRAQAIRDAVLLELSDKIPRIDAPIAITYSAYANGIDEKELLTELNRVLSRRSPTTVSGHLYFGVRNTDGELVELKCVCGPGDDAKPVLTIMMHDED